MIKNKRSLAMAAMFVTSIAVSFSGLIIRNIEAAGPWQINIYRNLSFLAVIAIICVVRYRSDFRSQVIQIKPPILWAALGLATTGIAIVQAFTHTLIANTVFIMSTVPLITMALSYIFLRETASKATLITMAISLLGLVVMLAEGIGSGSSYGNLMALIAAFGFAVFAVVARAHRNFEMLPALMIAAIIIITVSSIVAFDNLEISTHDLLLCVLWGAGISGIAHWFFVLSAKYIAATELTLFGLLEAALAPIWVWFFIGETPSRWVLIGGIAVIISVCVKTMLEMKKTLD